MLKQKPDGAYLINTENKNPCAYPNTAAQIYQIGECDGKNPRRLSTSDGDAPPVAIF
ncbi:hypothetical protein MUK42_35416 [Musa troglodytarum]|uniref:Uncharacterized protein n=1 Tax=Musa troglodytarum TaxID=320322 RepID=A0A9E7HJ29_9LILI|nr:hypothetical protein MUK42_35416 [Musa troglodytarum]